MCVLCHHYEESVSHFFFHCSYAREIWHLWWGVWNMSYWHVSSVAKFFDRWGKALVSSSFLHVAWALGPSFIIWHIWLERNRRIFQDVMMEAHRLWCKIIHSLGETVAAKCDLTEAVDPRDVVWCNHLHLPPQQGYFIRRCGRHPSQKINREGRWSPPQGVLKITTDESSQGNLGHAGIGGVGWDSSRTIQFIFSIYKGFHTNKLMEDLSILYVVMHGCQLGLRRIICEFDS